MANIRVPRQQAREFVEELLIAAGLDAQEARIAARVTVWFDLVGRSTQGLWRLSSYIKRLEEGVIRTPCHPAVDKQSGSVLVIDGNDGFGYYVGHVATKWAVKLARKTGVGAVAVRRSNHLGGGAYYGHMAAEEGQVGLVMSNSFPKVAPWGGAAAALGTNPFSLTCPTRSGQSVLIDFSTSQSAGSTIRKAQEDGTPLPEGLLVDESGNPITDPARAACGTLTSSGPKGFCMGLMVEILAGVLTGAGISNGVGSMIRDFSRPANVGHFILTLDIERFMRLEEWYDRMDALTTILKSVPTVAGTDEVLMPGETRWLHYEDQIKHGLDVDPGTQKTLCKLAKRHGVTPPWRS